MLLILVITDSSNVKDLASPTSLLGVSSASEIWLPSIKSTLTLFSLHKGTLVAYSATDLLAVALRVRKHLGSSNDVIPRHHISQEQMRLALQIQPHDCSACSML